MVKTRSGRKYGEEPRIPLTSPGKTLRKKPDIPLMQIHDLMPKIIAKMHNQELIRMRRTCSAVNKMVEKRTPILSKRVMEYRLETWTQKFIDIRIHIKEGENDISLLVNGHRQMIEGDLKVQLGPLTINEISVMKVDNCSPAKYEETLQWLRQMRFSCTKLELLELPVQFAFDILECIEQVAEVELTPDETLSSQDLLMLSTSRHSRAIELIEEYGSAFHKIPVEIWKNFRKIAIGSVKARTVKNLFKNIQSTNDMGNLEKIVFLDMYDPEIRIKCPFPRLWKGIQPDAVYSKELEKKQMVVIYHEDPHPDMRNYEISFFEKGSKALTDFFLGHEYLLIGGNVHEDPEKFTQADFKEKCEILRRKKEKPADPIGCMRGRRVVAVSEPFSDSEDESFSSSESESDADSEESESDADSDSESGSEAESSDSD